MKDFNLQKYLKKNVLLKEGIGGYVDMKPNTEEIGTAMGEDEESMTSSKGWQYDDEDFDEMIKAAQSLIDDGVEFQDIVDFLRKHIV